MPVPPSSPEAREAFERLAAALDAPHITRGRMMGRPILKTGGSMFACFQGDALAFRLGAGTPEHAAALGIRGAALFDPGGKGRPFKDWVSIPVTEADAWPQFAVIALRRLGAA
jgi:hypothetical protein